jgi:uncharacterized protein (DUF1810 family)
MSADPFNLARFVEAQEPIFDVAVKELRAGRKRSHWMWFVFPQLRSLGISPTAQFYGIGSLDEACAYLAHPLLGPRLALVTEAVSGLGDLSLHAIFGSPDDLKFCSSMTLFACASSEEPNLFQKALGRWCGGRPDARTLSSLGKEPPPGYPVGGG